MISPDFWKNKKVLVTGNTGFKGSWLSAWLLNLGADVIGYSLPIETSPSIFEAAALSKKMLWQNADVRDLPTLQETIKRHAIEVVFHLAAQPLVRRSYVDPLETYSTNVMGTVNVLEACRDADSVRAILIVTTDKCYENQEWVWGYRENDKLGGMDPYSSSKACAELVREAYMHSYFSPTTIGSHGKGVASGRAGNVVGGGDWAADRLIPDLVRGFTSATPTEIRNPDSHRPWQHVLEPLCGYMMVAEKLFQQDASACGAWNFGPATSDVQSAGYVADRFVKILGKPASWVNGNTSHAPHEAKMLSLDCSKAISELGWKPRWNLDQMLERTAVWYKTVATDMSAKNVFNALLDDIKTYTSS